MFATAATPLPAASAPQPPAELERRVDKLIAAGRFKRERRDSYLRLAASAGLTLDWADGDLTAPAAAKPDPEAEARALHEALFGTPGTPEPPARPQAATPRAAELQREREAAEAFDSLYPTVEQQRARIDDAAKARADRAAAMSEDEVQAALWPGGDAA